MLFAIANIAEGKAHRVVKKTVHRRAVVAKQRRSATARAYSKPLVCKALDGSSINSAITTMINRLMDEAFSHIGARYRSGSKGPSAFDCSGFTSYVFKKFDGTNIGCSSREQYARNTPVSRDEMRPGDLVFFTSPRSGRGVGHVGIVVDVDPKTNTFDFIHASSYTGVVVSKSTESFYARRYVGVRRVL